MDELTRDQRREACLLMAEVAGALSPDDAPWSARYVVIIRAANEFFEQTRQALTDLLISERGFSCAEAQALIDELVRQAKERWPEDADDEK